MIILLSLENDCYNHRNKDMAILMELSPQDRGEKKMG